MRLMSRFAFQPVASSSTSPAPTALRRCCSSKQGRGACGHLWKQEARKCARPSRASARACLPAQLCALVPIRPCGSTLHDHARASGSVHGRGRGRAGGPRGWPVCSSGDRASGPLCHANQEEAVGGAWEGKATLVAARRCDRARRHLRCGAELCKHRYCTRHSTRVPLSCWSFRET